MKWFAYLSIILTLSSSVACAAKGNRLKMIGFFSERIGLHTQKRFIHSKMRTPGFKPKYISSTPELKDSNLPKKIHYIDKTNERFIVPSEPIQQQESPIPHKLDENSILTELKKKI